MLRTINESQACLSVLCVVVLTSCQPATEDPGVDRESLEAGIRQIEQNLQPQFQVVGEPVDSWSIAERLDLLNIPGASVAVAVGGEIVWAIGYGMADINEGESMTTETLLLAGSVSKPVSAVRAHQLVEEGRLSLDGNVNDYLVSWKVPENAFTFNEKVTLRRILNHTAGLTVWGFPGYDKGDYIPTAVEVLDGKGNTDSVRVYKEPGESWMYSGGGYTIMQLMIVDVDRGAFEEVLQEHVLNPLGMTMSTFANPLPDSLHHLAATGYRRDGSEVEGKWPIYPEMAAAGLWTTPNQLLKYALAVQHIRESGEAGILKPETVDEMLRPGLNGHGLGPGISDDQKWWGHGGADEGFRTLLRASMTGGNAIAIMVNSDNGAIMHEIASSVAREYGWDGFEPRTKERVEVESALLNQYAGEYDFPGRDPVTVTLEEDYLTAKGSWIQDNIALLPESDSVFFDRRDGETVTFRMEESGSVKLIVNERLVGTRRE